MNDHIIERLFEILEARKGADPSASYTAKMYGKGTAKIAQKVGEEAVEVVIEAMQNNTELLKEESADLLYHLLLLWADQGVKPAEVWAVLESRMK